MELKDIDNKNKTIRPHDEKMKWLIEWGTVADLLGKFPNNSFISLCKSPKEKIVYDTS